VGYLRQLVGLPEERAIVSIALEMKLALVAMSSSNRRPKRWSSADGPIVAQVLPRLHQKWATGAERLPIIEFGASSGGFFVGSALVAAMKDTSMKFLDGFVAQIAAPDPRPLDTRTSAVYITMNLDKRTDKMAERIVTALAADKVVAKHIRLPQIPISESFFHTRTNAISKQESSVLSKALDEYLDPETKLLREDPRQSDWRRVIEPLTSDSLVADASPISEMTNVAWGMHEMSREGVQEALELVLSATVSLPMLHRSQK